jgi:hypothetical protein
MLVMAVKRHRWAYEASHYERHLAFCILHWQWYRALYVASQVFSEVCKVHLFTENLPEATRPLKVSCSVDRHWDLLLLLRGLAAHYPIHPFAGKHEARL